ncbi:helix-turn-helix domain-containing protein [Catelliglobosispora koreensis]|uniref:helix-turn-helix domain-containing protein n=1 Tax=Catelliglobosispora koreensis TaxID=129052 RepID=UPI000368546D|nr:helix-turn-helix domain-containing protein [Catelliglobosispora koreensis]
MVRPRKLQLPNDERTSKLAALAQAVRSRRETLGLRQDELAALAGCSTSFVSFVERAKPTIQVGKLLDVLAVLGLDLSVVPGTGRIAHDD